MMSIQIVSQIACSIWVNSPAQIVVYSCLFFSWGLVRQGSLLLQKTCKSWARIECNRPFFSEVLLMNNKLRIYQLVVCTRLHSSNFRKLWIESIDKISRLVGPRKSTLWWTCASSWWGLHWNFVCQTTLTDLWKLQHIKLASLHPQVRAHIQLMSLEKSAHSNYLWRHGMFTQFCIACLLKTSFDSNDQLAIITYTPGLILVSSPAVFYPGRSRLHLPWRPE